MSKTTKLWISPEVELRHAINGWPEPPPRYFTYYTVNGETAETGQRAAEIYREAIARAKEESIKLELSQDEEINIHLKYDAKPNTFIDFKGSVEVVWQHHRVFGGWTDCSEEHYKSQYRSFPKLFRQVARLKPDKSEKPINPDEIMTEAEMHEALEALKDPIAAAHARIKELEQENAEGFEKYQELIIQNRNLKERVKELEYAQAGLKDRILEALRDAWIKEYGVMANTFTDERDGHFMVGFVNKVLEELKIK